MATVKMGVSAFRIPERELSTRVPAMQNKNAGMKVPRKPESTTGLISDLGTSLNALRASGNMMMPAPMILMDAT